MPGIPPDRGCVVSFGGGDSCNQWWAVDVYFNADLEIAGVTLDLWEA